MFGRQRVRLMAAVALCAAAHTAAAAEKSAWNGVWTGTLGNSSKIHVTIADDKVTDYSYRGAKLSVAYSKVGKTTFSFGDGANYSMRLMRTTDGAAKATYHGRHGFIAATLTRQ